MVASLLVAVTAACDGNDYGPDEQAAFCRAVDAMVVELVTTSEISAEAAGRAHDLRPPELGGDQLEILQRGVPSFDEFMDEQDPAEAYETARDAYYAAGAQVAEQIELRCDIELG